MLPAPLSLLLVALLSLAPAHPPPPAAAGAPPPPPGAAPTPPPPRPGPPPGPPRGASGVVRRLDPTYAGGGRAGFVLYAGGRRFLLDLERDEAPGAPRNGGPPRCYYRGTVDGSPRSLAVFNLCGGLDGFFAVRLERRGA